MNIDFLVNIYPLTGMREELIDLIVHNRARGPVCLLLLGARE